MHSPEASEPTSPSEGSHGYSIDEKSANAFSTLEVVPPSNLEHYRRVSEVRRSFYPNWMSSGHGSNSETIHPTTGSGSEAPTATANENKRAPTRITICGMPQRAFWIVFGVIASLLAVGIIVGGAVGGTHKAAVVVPTVTAVVTVTYTQTKTTSAQSETFAAAVATTTVCVRGIGQGNYVGLCNFACSYGYCPPGPCTCTSSGTPVPTPPTYGINGIPLSSEDDSYLGLCSFCCNHGYCPSSACTTSS
ncbi:hypothetical protein TSTA_041830 [Talaromyces stipitatus ATCC 10500]|uniref:Uncharacterized protein n=1 Tax=Talaromyces stipitatus (strain ATCC 10500 / CBS 375.48 / QM 6759 / NRRL 1006) TaxID=441959 RepID=B8MJB8_TALSN|nr:uncharacterized protein TSTA_041830 [Talaromyces stipitatus ATCC 10500]EED14707.1 hypothetical protein TSTA_041830 [Talaromyces stipitatus ATCC 10500]